MVSGQGSRAEERTQGDAAEGEEYGEALDGVARLRRADGEEHR